MVQIHQSYTLDPLENYLRNKSNATNKELYSLCNAVSKNEKSSVRTKKKRILESIKNDVSDVSDPKKRSDAMKGRKLIPPLTPDGSDHLTAELLEKLILNALQEDTTPAMVRCAVEFYSKVTAKEGEEVENIDLTGFLKVFENTYTKASSD
jgi:hypothetical protein